MDLFHPEPTFGRALWDRFVAWMRSFIGVR